MTGRTRRPVLSFRPVPSVRPVPTVGPPPPGRPSGPFAVLGFDQRTDLTDDEIRAAWRRVAAASHPDRADGGDPALFAVAAAAYTELRTRFGRNEARANLEAAADRGASAGPPRGAVAAVGAGRPAGILARIRLGRPVRLVLRALLAAGAAAAGFLVAGSGPAGPALATGALTWLALTVRRDLSPP